MNKKIIVAVAAVLVIAGYFTFANVSEASTGYTFPSTNAANQVNGHPSVAQKSAEVGQTTLTFTNDTNSLAAYETRIDGVVLTSGTGHPVVTGDFINSVTVVDGRGISVPVLLDKVFSALSLVEVRLALGGERDWDFDWTPFSVPSAPAAPTAPAAPMGTGQIVCSSPTAPGYQVGVPGGGCGGTEMFYRKGETYTLPNGTREMCEYNMGCVI